MRRPEEVQGEGERHRSRRSVVVAGEDRGLTRREIHHRLGCRGRGGLVEQGHPCERGTERERDDDKSTQPGGPSEHGPSLGWREGVRPHPSRATLRSAVDHVYVTGGTCQSTEMRAMRSAFCSSKSSKLIFLASNRRWSSSTRAQQLRGGELGARLRRREQLLVLGTLSRCPCRAASPAWRRPSPSSPGRAGASRSSSVVRPWDLLPLRRPRCHRLVNFGGTR